MKKAWMLFIFILVLCKSAIAFDDLIDNNFEKRINQIYKSTYSKIVSDSEWSLFIDKVESETYTIREGDTLWELSSIFFGDGFYWSKIWSLNDRITNPHLIYPNSVVQFFSGTVAQAPGVQVVPGEAPPEPGEIPLEMTQGPVGTVVEESGDSPLPDQKINYADVPPSHLYPGAPRIPPPQNTSKPVLQNIPPAFATASFRIEKYDSTGMSFDVRPPTPIQSRLVPHSFLFEGVPSRFPNVGKIVEMEDGEEFTGWGKIVYVKLNKEFAVGDVLTVIGPEFDFNFSRYRGTVMTYMGEIKLIEAISRDGFRAKIITSIMPITTNSFVSEEAIPAFSNEMGSQNGNEYYIIGGNFDEERGIFGQGDIIFLSGGDNQGVKVYDTFAIYKNRTIRYHNSNYWKSPRPIGMIKVFRVEPNTSSAVILWLDEELRPMDTTGKMVAGPMNIGEGERNDLKQLESSLEDEDQYEEVGTAGGEDKSKPNRFEEVDDELDGEGDESDLEGDDEVEGGDDFDEGDEAAGDEVGGDESDDIGEEPEETAPDDDIGEGGDDLEGDDDLDGPADDAGDELDESSSGKPGFLEEEALEDDLEDLDL